MAGGSCAAIPVRDADVLQRIATMKPQSSEVEGTYLLQGEQGMLYLKLTGKSLDVSLDNGNYVVCRIDEKTGNVTRLKNAKREVKLDGKGVFLILKK
jgi:hypothetical protein